MGGKTTGESDETRLKMKIAARGTGHKGPKENEVLRSLKKRLKRAQRKRRALALRKANAASKKTAADEAKK